MHNELIQRIVGLPQRRASVVSAVLLLACAQGGCEWVLDIPRERERDSAVDDPERDASAPRDSGTRRDAGLDAGASEDDAEVDDDATVGEDGAVDDDAGGDLDASGEEDAGDASDEPDAEPPPCTDQTTWYVDEDRDGYGIAEGARTVCPKPAGNWAARAGDCQDENDNVNPGQRRFYGVAYESATGVASFDYDCSGTEEASGNQTALDCGALDLLACQGSGYAATRRTGAGVGPVCGSNIIETCDAVVLTILICAGSDPRTTDEPFLCR